MAGADQACSVEGVPRNEELHEMPGCKVGPDNHALATRRKEIDQLVLANLLRMNSVRSTE